MSLVRLLTSGKSLVTFRNSTGHYRMRASNLLPKFGSAKNPFSSSTQRTGQTSSSSVLEEPSESAPDQMTAPATPEQNKFVAEVPRRPSSAPANQGQNRMRTRFSGWLKKLKPATWWKRPAVAKPTIPKFSKAPIQGELSLDNVKVVRNDLSEADVEIVVTRQNTKKTPVAQTEAAAAELVRT